MARDDAEGKLPAHERVYRDLRARILGGELAPGDPVTLRGLAEALDVSMTPAREAVRRLVAERALAITATGRVVTPLPDGPALDELFRARALLEPELARRALPCCTVPLRAALRRVDASIDRHLAAGDAAGYVRANTEFHALLYRAAESPALLALVESVWLQTAPVMRRIYGLLGTSRLADHHEAALAALDAGDADALAAAIRADIEQGAALASQALATTDL